MLLFSPGQVRNNSDMEYNRLFVFVPKTDKETDLENVFSQYGEISKVHIVTNKDTGESKGIAFITYTKLESHIKKIKKKNITIKTINCNDSMLFILFIFLGLLQLL